MAEPITAHLHTAPPADPARVSQVIAGSEATLGSTIRPIKYRYMLADIRTGALIAMLPMTSVSYSVGIYSGQDMSGTVYLPDLYLDLMMHPPSFDYERLRHPDQGSAIGSMFECGNRAIYIMRNDEVVWGGILWTRSYSSGDKTLSLTALSWDGYIYYRALRKSVVFLTATDKYLIWRALLAQTLAISSPLTGGYGSDFGWRGEDGHGKNAGAVLSEGGTIPWTGVTRNSKSNQPLVDYDERWPFNSPAIELPPAALRSGKTAKVDQDWRGYDMKTVGGALQDWADTNTLITKDGFEYRVLSWWDEAQQKFRQRYTFGEMIYPGDDYRQTPTGIANLLLGKNTNTIGHSADNRLVFDYPGQIKEWSLSESMEDAATRVIVMGNLGDGANKIAAYDAQDSLLYPVPANKGTDGWLLYDKIFGYDVASTANQVTYITDRAKVLLGYHHPPTAATLDDVDAASNPATQRSSTKTTQLSVTLYIDPTATYPSWRIGDWAAFAIADPFYGGKIYLVRRIIQYTVTVVPDHESDYSHEQIQLTLTDETKTEPGG